MKKHVPNRAPHDAGSPDDMLSTAKAAYDNAKEHVRDVLSTEKSKYYKGLLQNSTPKNMFLTINKLLNKRDRVLPESDSTVALASAFCNYFTKKVKDIRQYIDDYNDSTTNTKTLESSLLKPPAKLEFFRLLTEDEVRKLVRTSSSKSCALDLIPTWLLKRHLTAVLPRLTDIINQSLSTGVFPSSLGSAMISPVIKKPSLNKEELKNYRPVSNIRYMSKLIETAVSHQLTAHVEDNQLMDSHQSAYRAKHST